MSSLAIVPLQATPSQTLTVTLGGQATRINIYQLSTGLFVDVLLISGGVTTPVISGQVALNLVTMIRETYLGFIGDLVFIDTQGADDPVYSGLGDRYQLVYGTSADLAPVVATASLPAFTPWAYVIKASPTQFLSYDGVNPIAASASPVA